MFISITADDKIINQILFRDPFNHKLSMKYCKFMLPHEQISTTSPLRGGG